MRSYTFFFLVMRTFRIHAHSNFQIYHTVLWTIVTGLYITSPGLILLLLLLYIYIFLGLYPQYMEVSRLGVEWELPAYTTATPGPSLVCHLHHSSQQHQILNPLSEARDQTHILMDTSWILSLLSRNRNSPRTYFETETLYLLTSLTHFAQPLSPSLTTPPPGS